MIKYIGNLYVVVGCFVGSLGAMQPGVQGNKPPSLATMFVVHCLSQTSRKDLENSFATLKKNIPAFAQQVAPVVDFLITASGDEEAFKRQNPSAYALLVEARHVSTMCIQR